MANDSAVNIRAAVQAHLAQLQKPAVLLQRAQGDFVHYSIDVEGGSAQWVFSCQEREIIKQSDPEHPTNHYEWDWIRNPGEADSDDDFYVVTFLFVGVTKYHIVIDHRDSGGNLIELLQDRTFQGDDQSSPQFATLHVLIV